MSWLFIKEIIDLGGKYFLTHGSELSLSVNILKIRTVLSIYLQCFISCTCVYIDSYTIRWGFKRYRMLRTILDASWTSLNQIHIVCTLESLHFTWRMVGLSFSIGTLIIQLMLKKVYWEYSWFSVFPILNFQNQIHHIYMSATQLGLGAVII